MSTLNLDAKWTHWIRENLIKGSDESAIASVLSNSFSITPVKALAAVQKIRNMPLPTQQVVTQNSGMERREWMLSTLDKLAQLSSDYGVINSVTPPSFADFLQHYYATNRPVLLERAFDHWQAAKWTPDTLLAVAQDSDVEVQFNRDSNPRFEMDSLKHKETMAFRRYHQMVMDTSSSNNFYMTANNAKANQAVFKPLFNDMGNIADGYFDEGLHATRSFIWFGPKGNFTPLHHDQTNNMFLQVYGRKTFWLVSPLQTPYLYNETAVFSPLDLRTIDHKAHPLAKQVKPIKITLEPGDTLFIPIGWWHQVESLDVSISLTMTNFNALNSFT